MFTFSYFININICLQFYFAHFIFLCLVSYVFFLLLCFMFTFIYRYVFSLFIFIIFMLHAHDTIQRITMVSSFLSFFINEIITINNQNGISMHCYGVVDWKHVHVLLTFEWLLKGGTIINIKVIIFYVLMKFNHISKCLMWLKIDGALRG